MTKFLKSEQETLEKAFEANPFWMDAILKAAEIMIERRKKYAGTADPYYNFVDMQRRNPNRTMLDVFLWYVDIKRSRLSATQEDFKDESLVDTLVDLLNYAALALGWFSKKRKPEDVIPIEEVKDANIITIVTEENYNYLFQTAPFKKTIGLDLDGVLNEYDGIWKGYEHTYPILPKAIMFLTELKKLDYRICLMTARRDLNSSIKWLEDVELAGLIDMITNWKVPCHVYIDDRAIRFNGNFDFIIQEISQFIPWWSTGYDSLKEY